MNILPLLDRPIAFQRSFIRLDIGVTAALFLSQMIYWTNRSDDDGWVYKTQEEWEEETGLSRYEQEGARKKLRSIGVLQEKKKGVPARLFYKVDNDVLFQALVAANKDAEKPHTGMQETSKQECGKPASSSAGKPRSNTEITTEITTETTTEITKNARKQKNTFSLPAGLNLDAWGLWMQYRIDRKLKPYKQTTLGAGAVAKNLIELAGGDVSMQMRIVLQSINNQWQGLFALKQQRTGESKIAQAQRAAEQAIADGRVGYDYDTPFGKR